VKRLGVIGGMGPLATAHFYRLVTQLDSAQFDQEHFEILILSIPSIPDRTRFILGHSNSSPVPAIEEAAKLLKDCGAECIAVPCITSHGLISQKNFELPFINMIDIVFNELRRRRVRKFGVLATDGTLKTGIFSDRAKSCQMQMLIPDEAAQRRIMANIYDNIKRGDISSTCTSTIVDTSADLISKGAECILLGCTELSLLDLSEPQFVDMLRLLASECVSYCRS